MLHGKEIKSKWLQEVLKLPRVPFTIMAVLFIIIFVHIYYLNCIFPIFPIYVLNVSKDAFYAFVIRVYLNSGVLLIAG